MDSLVSIYSVYDIGHTLALRFVVQGKPTE